MTTLAQKSNDSHMMNTIKLAHFPEDLSTVQRIFREYAEDLGFDLGFQGFEQELISLPGKYTLPRGCLLLAWCKHEVVGCVAFRPIDDQICEMKRLYVKSGLRSLNLGKQLVERICNEARAQGYRKMLLDTLPSMQAAIKIYKSFGFKPVEPYVFNPIEGAMFLGLDF
jgi:ribosomal protein S18 acetylase RimI-like enzyme